MSTPPPKKLHPYHRRQVGTTFHFVESNDAKRFKELEEIIKEIMRQQEDPRFEGAHVIINDDQYDLELGADPFETLEFFKKLRDMVSYKPVINAKFELISTSTTTKAILDYVFNRHCEDSIMAHSLELTVVLKEKSTKFHLSKGMDHHEIEVHLEAHKAELGL